jgi:hypothetical protein
MFGKAAYMAFAKAKQYVTTLRLNSFTEWQEYTKSNELPDGIPKRPDLVYKANWVSWSDWLGRNEIQDLIVKRQREEEEQRKQFTQVYYIIHHVDDPGNVFEFGVEPGGLSVMKDWWEKDKFDIVNLFNHEPLRMAVIKQIVEMHSRPYLGQSRTRLTPNIYEIIALLQQQLMTITKA